MTGLSIPCQLHSINTHWLVPVQYYTTCWEVKVWTTCPESLRCNVLQPRVKTIYNKSMSNPLCQHYYYLLLGHSTHNFNIKSILPSQRRWQGLVRWSEWRSPMAGEQFPKKPALKCHQAVSTASSQSHRRTSRVDSHPLVLSYQLHMHTHTGFLSS